MRVRAARLHCAPVLAHTRTRSGRHTFTHTPAPAQPGLEALLEAPAGAGSFGSVYKQQTTALDEYIEAQPFAAIKQLLFDILLGQRQLKSAWNPALDQGTIMVGSNYIYTYFVYRVVSWQLCCV